MKIYHGNKVPEIKEYSFTNDHDIFDFFECLNIAWSN